MHNVTENSYSVPAKNLSKLRKKKSASGHSLLCLMAPFAGGRIAPKRVIDLKNMVIDFSFYV